MARDYIREHLGELIEEQLVKAKYDGDDYLEKATSFRWRSDNSH